MTKELVRWKRPLSSHFNDVGNSKMRIKPKPEFRFNLIIYVFSLSQPWSHYPSFLFLLFWDRLWLRSRKRKKKKIPSHLSFICPFWWLLLLSLCCILSTKEWAEPASCSPEPRGVVTRRVSREEELQSWNPMDRENFRMVLTSLMFGCLFILWLIPEIDEVFDFRESHIPRLSHLSFAFLGGLPPSSQKDFRMSQYEAKLEYTELVHQRRAHLGAFAAVLYVILEVWSQKCANTIYFLTKKKLLINDIVRSWMRDPCRLTDGSMCYLNSINMNSKKSEELLLCIYQTRRSKHTIWTKDWLLSILSKLAHSVPQKTDCWCWGTLWALGSVLSTVWSTGQSPLGLCQREK